MGIGVFLLQQTRDTIAVTHSNINKVSVLQVQPNRIKSKLSITNKWKGDSGG